MDRYIRFLLLLIITCKISAQSNVGLFTSVVQDSIEINSIRDELNSIDEIDEINETINLKNLMVVNCQIDSVLRKIVNEKRGKFVSSYYLTLAAQDESLYIEIMNVDSHNNVIDLYNRGVSSDNYFRKGMQILGCIIYNGAFFYVMSFPKPNSVEEKDFTSLFHQTNKNISIKKEKIEDSLFFLESPMLIYQYVERNLIQLKW